MKARERIKTDTRCGEISDVKEFGIKANSMCVGAGDHEVNSAENWVREQEWLLGEDPTYSRDYVPTLESALPVVSCLTIECRRYEEE